ncbi:MAG: hypothetical protein ABIZ81_05630 [Opitutaceae bacterium]
MLPRFLVTLSCILFFGGCIRVKVDPVEVHATLDVNVKVDREVSDLLTDVYGDSKTINARNPSSK